MRVALKCDGQLISRPFLTEDGELAGNDSGAVVARRILGAFENPILIYGDEVRQTRWGEIRPLHKIDVNDTVILSMDALETLALYSTLKLTPRWHHPKVMNVGWYEVADFKGGVTGWHFAASAAGVPFFGNGPKIVEEARAHVNRVMGVKALTQMETGWAFLGIDLDRIDAARVDRPENRVPVLKYPAVLAADRKRPELFVEIAQKVTMFQQASIHVRLLPGKSGLSNPVWDEPKRDGRFVIEPVLPSKDDYYRSLWEDTAFLATSKDESYGLAYVEAMYAGQIGVFLQAPWVQQIVPDGYPLVARDAGEAGAYLALALREPDRCRQLIESAIGFPLRDWIRENHDARKFETGLQQAVREWFPERTTTGGVDA